MLTQTQHAVESNPRMVSSPLVNGNTVNDVALAQIFERPEEMLRRDAKHGGANANAGIERDDLVVFQFLVNRRGKELKNKKIISFDSSVSGCNPKTTLRPQHPLRAHILSGNDHDLS